MENENVCRRKAQTAAERKRKSRQKKMSQMTEEEVKQFKLKEKIERAHDRKT